jgi:hypothetical protein
MSRHTEFRTTLKKVRAKDRRLERWIVDNWPTLEQEYGTGRLDLREFIEVVRALELTNTHGGRLSDATISKTWARVRKRMLTAPPLHLPKAGEIAPGVIVLPAQEASLQPATGSAVAYARCSASIGPERFTGSDLDSREPGARRLTADEKLARIVERTYASHQQMPKPVK